MKDVIECGGVGVIVDAVKGNPHNHTLVIHACRALCTVADCSESESDAQRHRHATIERADGVSAILKAMRAHAGDTDLLEAACTPLGHLAQQEDGMGSILRKGGVEDVLSAMGAFRRNPVILEQGCRVLSKLDRMQLDAPTRIPRRQQHTHAAAAPLAYATHARTKTWTPASVQRHAQHARKAARGRLLRR